MNKSCTWKLRKRKRNESGRLSFSHLCPYEIGFLPMWETSISHDHVTPRNNPLKGGRKRIHCEPIHASLVPGWNSYPSGEISLSCMDNHDGFLHSWLCTMFSRVIPFRINSSLRLFIWYQCTVFDLITALTTISAQSSNFALRKQAYSNILENLPAKYEKFQIKILIFFLCLLKNIDCGYSLEPPRRSDSNEYHNICFEQKYEK